MIELKEPDISSIYLSIQYQISKIEEIHYIHCSHKSSDKELCLSLSYQLWMLKVQKSSLCENNFTVIKK
jgi:hypothetical protein